ncbi:MAG TPA: SpoIIE family protein phosphatase [Anaeromyxobacter sp.]
MTPLRGTVKKSLAFRILATTLVLLAFALAVAVLAFERVARNVIADAVHSHLGARAKEVQDSVDRFQRERTRTVHDWSGARAMQDSFDMGDPKFAEDHLRRAIQDQEGAIAAAVLLTADEKVITLVRYAPGKQWGLAVESLRGRRLDVAKLRGHSGEDAISSGLSPLSSVDPGESDRLTMVMTTPVHDFFGDLTGWLVVAIAPDAIPRLLEEVNGKGSTFVPVVADRTHVLVLTLPRFDAQIARASLEAPAGGAIGSLERIAPVGREGAFLAVRTAPAEATPGWSALMLVDESEASGRIERLRAILLGLFVVVMVVGAVFAALSLRQASKPLADVAASMVRVAGGDLSTRVEAGYTGELGQLTTSFNTMVQEVERSRSELKRTEALRREVEIAHRIQTAILPVSPAAPGFEIAARMRPADDVGGDLYDILTFEDELWVLVGDVSGHGINSGLVMMMAQAAAYAAIAEDPHCAPAGVIAAVNRLLHENVRRRMRRDDYMTLMAARHVGDGRFLAAGAHQPIFVTRRDGQVEVVETAGPWVGMAPSVEPPPVAQYEFRLAPGELVCFLTDGILEAQDAKHELFGEERVKALLAGAEIPTAASALVKLFEAVERHSPEPADDMTAVVLRREK